jgi:hypothetical protein
MKSKGRRKEGRGKAILGGGEGRREAEVKRERARQPADQGNDVGHGEMGERLAVQPHPSRVREKRDALVEGGDWGGRNRRREGGES